MFVLVPLWCVGNQTFQLEDIAANQGRARSPQPLSLQTVMGPFTVRVAIGGKSV